MYYIPDYLYHAGYDVWFFFFLIGWSHYDDDYESFEIKSYDMIDLLYVIMLIDLFYPVKELEMDFERSRDGDRRHGMSWCHMAIANFFGILSWYNRRIDNRNYKSRDFNHTLLLSNNNPQRTPYI